MRAHRLKKEVEYDSVMDGRKVSFEEKKTF